MKTYDQFDDAYHDILETILDRGTTDSNRTDVDTRSIVGYGFKIPIGHEHFPLLTLKDLSGNRFHSMKAELLWFLSGQHHIRDLSEQTSIWDPWADDDDLLDFAYGRFWRRFPVPDLDDQLPGEEWVTGHYDKMQQWVSEEERNGRHVLVFDQIKYILDTLQDQPHSRRMILNAHHPANGSVANPPACHCMATFNVQDGSLNCHLTMRSSDVGIGLPFNVAQYSLLTMLLCEQTPFEPGHFIYSGTDVHLYEDNGEYDQIEYARDMLDRNPYDPPSISITNRQSIDDYRISDMTLDEYQSYEPVSLKPVP